MYLFPLECLFTWQEQGNRIKNEVRGWDHTRTVEIPTAVRQYRDLKWRSAGNTAGHCEKKKTI